MGLRGTGSSELDRIRKAAPKKRAAEPWENPRYTRLQRVLRFVEAMPVTKGVKAGTTMKLLDDQVEFLTAIYGRRANAPPVRLAIKSAPRGNGKTGLVAALALCHLMGPEAEPRGEVYSAAIDRDQASIMFREMEAMILAYVTFAERVNIIRHTKRIEVLSGIGKGSIYESMSADARRAHGLAPSLWIYDELSQARDRKLLDNLQTAMGKRKQSLGIIISTQAPTDEHPLSQVIDDGLARDDPSVIVHLLAAPQDADPFDPEVIRAVNPAFGHFLQEADVFAEAERARNIPAFQSTFFNLRLNQRVDAAEDQRLCNAAIWKLGNPPVRRDQLAGQKCYAALDLSAKHDLTSLTLVFPDRERDPCFDILQFFWTPHEQLARRPQMEKEKFQTWIRQGHIIPVPGPTIRFNFVAQHLINLSREFDIQVIAYDKWRMDDFKADLAEIDPNFPTPMEPFRQGRESMTPAIEAFIDLAEHGRIRHGGNPVLTACVVNAILKVDHADNKVIDKPRSRSRGPVRVDGAVTLCMALEMAKRWTSEPPIDVSAMVA